MDYEYLSLAVGDTGAERHWQADSVARAAVTGWAVGALRRVAEDPGPLRAVSHPLGFTCLPMERSGPYGVCVHLWSPEASPADPAASRVHSHCWRLTSYALFGGLENRFMDVTDAGDGDERDRYRLLEVRSREDTDEVLPTARLVRCVPGQRQAISTGDVYSLDAGDFHVTLVPPGTETATVALGRTIPGASDLSLGPPGSLARRTRRVRCDAERTAHVARVVLDRMLAPAAGPAPGGPWPS